MKSNRIKWIGGALVLMLLAAFGVAESAGMPRHHRGGMFGFGFYAHELDLTDAQRSQMKDILTKEKPVLQPLMQQMGQSRHQLRQLEMSGTL
jgi:Spy/CpxP family protein refolding chaperone